MTTFHQAHFRASRTWTGHKSGQVNRYDHHLNNEISLDGCTYINIIFKIKVNLRSKIRRVRFKMSDELFQDVTSISIGWIKKSLLSHLGIG